LVERCGAILGKMKIVSSPIKIMKKCYPRERQCGIENQNPSKLPSTNLDTFNNSTCGV
jgi:hypothetical protein